MLCQSRRRLAAPRMRRRWPSVRASTTTPPAILCVLRADPLPQVEQCGERSEQRRALRHVEVVWRVLRVEASQSVDLEDVENLCGAMWWNVVQCT